jgi:hypothetical protein
VTIEIQGRIARDGPIVDIRFATSEVQRSRLLNRGMAVPDPVTIPGLLDTGAAATSLDTRIIGRLHLLLQRKVNLVTNTTDPEGEPRSQYRALATLGEGTEAPLEKPLLVIEADFSRRGFLALIGRDLLQWCVFTYDGPGGRFTLGF